MEITGKIKDIKADIQVSANYTKSELVVTTDEQYPQHILIEFGGQKADLVDPYRIGEDVKVSINLRGREWTSPSGEVRYFNSIQGWKIERLNQSGQQPQQQMPPMPAAQAFEPASSFNEEEHDDLPF